MSALLAKAAPPLATAEPDQVQLSAAIPAALAAPLLATVGVAYWERWTGSALMLNLYKCSLASLLFVLVLVSQSLAGVPMISPTAESVRMLMLSAFLGIVVGDMAWLKAIQLIGARLCILLGALKPFVAKFVGIVCLGQPLSILLGLGISLTSVGLILAHLGRTEAPSAASTSAGAASSLIDVAQPQASKSPAAPLEMAAAEAEANEAGSERGSAGGVAVERETSKLALGIALQLFNMVIDVAGAALTRAYGGNATSWQINAIRFGSAAIIMLLFTLGASLSALARAVAPPSWASFPVMSFSEWVTISAGVLLVTFFTPALGNFALFRLPFGAWSALTALGPVYSIPVFWILRGEKTRVMGITGAVLAASGAAVVSAAVAGSH